MLDFWTYALGISADTLITSVIVGLVIAFVLAAMGAILFFNENYRSMFLVRLPMLVVDTVTVFVFNCVWWAILLAPTSILVAAGVHATWPSTLWVVPFVVALGALIYYIRQRDPRTLR
ncbi:MAG: hypothetical protein H6797_03595 [Candidatus Nomurabacteria bacterium]|nr:MAG: hypothetical protein H6797_03595 [Candidatus Nomurabacteria bacterium]